MRILVINGPNLNLLGAREESHYGSLTLNSLEEKIKSNFPEDEFDFYQSNVEGELINVIHAAGEKYHGLIINPGGYSHTSVAIHDALEICKIPKIEVHLSNLAKREEFRQNFVTASACNGHLSGFKEDGYLAGVYLLKKIVEKT